MLTEIKRFFFGVLDFLFLDSKGLILLKSGAKMYIPPGLTFITFCILSPHSVFRCYARFCNKQSLFLQTALTVWFFKTLKRNVYCAVRTESSCSLYINFCLQRVQHQTQTRIRDPRSFLDVPSGLQSASADVRF